MCKHPEDLDLEGINTVAIDIETYDPNLKTKGLGAIRGDGFITGVAVATGKDTVYFSIKHSDDNKSEEELKEFWDQLNNKLLQNPDITKVFHNAIYDVCWLRATTGKRLQGRLVDTMIAASVIDETRFKYSLDSLSKDYLNEAKYKYDLQEKVLEWSKGMIKDPMSNMHRIPGALAKDYAKQDVDLTLKLWNLFDKKLDEVLYTKTHDDGKVEEKTCRKIFELETKLFRCLVDMKFKGVRIDVPKIKKFGAHLTKRKTQILQAIENQTGIKIDIWAASSIKNLLDQQNITDYKKTPKSGMPQLPKDYLKTHKNKCLRMIAKAREYDKAINTFITGLLSYVHEGRIHADVNQIRSDQGGTVTGSFSMSNPNLLQIPSRSELGSKIRELFIPEEGHEWASFDYSQQEPRLVVHYALKNKLQGAEVMAEAYKENPNTDFHKIVAEMAKITRKQAKTINLGLFYGMGKGKLANSLELDKDEAEELFDQYHTRVPFVRKLSKGLQDFAENNKNIFTLEDRFCRFDRWEPINKEWNPEKGMFEITEYKEIEGVKQIVKVPVPILKKEEAENRYHKDLAINGKPADPHCKNFEQHYRPAFTYKALNRLIQGSAADMTKKAMVELYEIGIVPHIQIHDELCFSIKSTEEADLIKKTMEGVIELEVPNKVDFESGLNWGSIKG